VLKALCQPCMKRFGSRPKYPVDMVEAFDFISDNHEDEP
jgi:hypothetical protein